MFLDLRQRYEEPAVASAFNLWLDIHAPIELVFRFLTEAGGLNRWWTSDCQTEPRPGGAIHCVWDGEKRITGDAIFRQFEPPNRFVVQWTHNNGEPIECNGTDPRGMRWPALNIYELMLIDGNLTRLYLHDLGVNRGPKYEGLRKATEKGWVETMTRLKKVVEQHFRQKVIAGKKKREEIRDQREKKNASKIATR